MGCIQSSPSHDVEKQAKSATVPVKAIAIERQKEAKGHFGLRRHTVVRVSASAHSNSNLAIISSAQGAPYVLLLLNYTILNV